MRIMEVGPRDGLQNESRSLDVSTRIEFVRRLGAAGLKDIEAGAFVSPKWVPQMSGSAEVARGLKDFKANLAYLVPNERGMTDAIAGGVREVAVFTAASESFARKNINCSIDESFTRFEPVIRLAKAHKIRVRGYVSVALYCPFEGKVKPQVAAKVAARLLELGVYEVSLGDTIGAAVPKEVEALLKLVLKKIPARKIAMHLHDTRGTALPNVLQSLQMGIRAFDSSLGGLGGCPYAPGAAGNLATEDLIYFLHGMGHKTGVELHKLIEINKWVSEKLGRELPSRVARAGGGPRG